MNIIHKTFILLSLAVTIYSCGSRSSAAYNSPFDPNVSRTTGWEYNNADFAGIDISPYDGQVPAPGTVFIEGGTFTMGRNSADISGSWNNTPRRVTVSSFYMDQYEVSNADWREYLWWLSFVFQHSPNVIDEATPDTLVWARALSYNDKMITSYLRHPAYNDYPVVGVSWEQVQDYCLWRTDRVNEALLVNLGIMQPVDYASVRTMETQAEVFSVIFSTHKYLAASGYNPPRGEEALLSVYGDEKKVGVADGVLYPDYRLPTEAEWEYAAYGLLIPSDNGTGYADRRIYPWDGDDFRDVSEDGQGRMLANYVIGRGDYMGIAGDLNDGGDYTAPIWAYTPNDFGLYNMAGNVNEWVGDVYRSTSSELVHGHNPFRGNSFQKPVMKDTIIDGLNTTVAVLTPNGQVMTENISDTAFAGYPSSDLRNYKDGDPGSSYTSGDWKKNMTPDEATALLYNADGNSGEGMLSPGLTNTVRVYKGGGYNDRAHYLNPATRRYLEQASAKDDLGFRCAMDRVGASTSYKK